jgi:hypothetical protein
MKHRADALHATRTVDSPERVVLPRAGTKSARATWDWRGGRGRGIAITVEGMGRAHGG